MDVNASNIHYKDPSVELRDTVIIFGIALQSVTILLIIVLNVLSLLVLRCTRGIQDTTKIFLMSLTASDLCNGMFSATPNLLTRIYKRWVLGNLLCVLWKVVAPMLYSTSILSLLLLTTDRFLAIAYSLRYPNLMTPLRSKIITTLLWTLLFVIFLILFGLLFPATISSDGTCEYGAPAVYRYGTICSITIPLGTILILYIYILKVARRQARRIAALNHIGNPPGRNDAPRMSTKSATTVLIITGALCLSWTPQLIIHLLKSRNISISSGLDMIAYSIFISNCWLNGIIYYWRNREFRQAFRSLVYRSRDIHS